MSNNFQYLQHPLFAPASQQQQQQQQQQGGQPQQQPQQNQDDFDLNDIFADYFSNDFEDPLQAYNSSMATFGAKADPNTQAGLAQGSHPNANLPTGGIKTQFHWGGTSAAQVHAAAVAQQQQQQQKQSQAAAMPVAKIARTDPGMGNGTMNLPVGVGIRMGGIGGVAPSTAQDATMNPATAGGLWDQGFAGMSEQAVAERRQRNREHAKRSRVRKKFMLESLQGEVHQLQKENESLRLLVQTHLPNKAQDIIAECCKTSTLFDDAPGDGQKPKSEMLEKQDLSLMESLSGSQQNFVLSDPRLPDNPIVFASPGFYKMTGYTSKEVLGRNCRFLQGPGTDPRAIDVIRKAMQSGADTTVCILNYKADGTPFWNQFFLASLRDSDNNIVNYVGVQCEVEPETAQNALEEKVNAVLPLDEKK